MISDNKPPITWRQLIEFGKTIEDKFLDEKVILWGDGRGEVIYSLEKLKEDYVCFDNRDGYEEVSTFETEKYKEEHRNLFNEEFDIEDNEGYLYKGTPIIWID